MTNKLFNIAKRSFVAALALCVAVTLAVCPATAFAADAPLISPSPTSGAAQNQAKSYIIDETGTFDAATKASLEAEAKQMSETTGIGVYLLYVSNIGTSSVRSYAEAQYKSRGLGLGDDTSGIMFLVAKDSRDYVTITHGKGINAFTDSYIEDLEDDIVAKLKNNDWVSASQVYLADSKKAVEYYAEHGEPYKEPLNIPMTIAISLAVGAIVAFITTRSKASAHKTAMEAVEADDYVSEGSFDLIRAKDVYQGTAVVCIARHNENRGGGGSTVSASGFGGSGGGKF